MPKIRNKYIGHLPKLVTGHCYVATRSSIEKQHFTKDKTGADFTKELKPRLRLKYKTLVLNFVNRMLSLWS